MSKLNGRKIEAMHRLYGEGPEGAQCKECDHLYQVYPTDRCYNKCKIYGSSCGESTDWRQKWPACGMFNKEPEPGYCPVITLLKHQPRIAKLEAIEGQIKMEGV